MSEPRTFESHSDCYEVTRRWPRETSIVDEATNVSDRIEPADAPLN